jgi:hypothetical protein
VALQNNLDRVYEISCVTKPLTFTNAPGAVGNTYSFETCIQYCNDNAVTCNWGVVWTNSSSGFGSCQIATGYTTGNPPAVAIGSTIATSQRWARLLNSSLINDGVYFQARNSPAGDLGFCKGPNNNNYDRAFIALQYIDASYSGDTNQIHQLACGAYSWFGSGGNNIDPATVAPLYGGGVTYATPEACARLCNYNYKAGVSPRCQAWQFTNTGVCQMYSERAGGTAPSPVVSAGISVAGIRIGGVTQTAVPNYKRNEDAQPMGRFDRRTSGLEYAGEAVKPDYIIPGL